MSKINCETIKKEYYDCLKSNNLGFDPELLKFNAGKIIKNFPNLRIDDKIMKKCGSDKLANCLSAKYDILSINEKELSKYYEDKYNKEIIKGNAMNLKNNLIEK